MRYIAAVTERDMEIFMSHLAMELLSVEATVLIDLYFDEPPSDERIQKSFQAMTEIAGKKSPASMWRRLFKGGDSLMGVEVDLSRGDQVSHFSRLAHQVINAEAWSGDRQLFGTIESPVRVWVDMPDDTIEKILTVSRDAGSSVRMEPES
ncbi:hypothetical protein [Streptomyces sp. NPDC006274]|uniref:hypothetical protein n=1 Tax=unclassified Streptomyces TaxID=2593676 RepID=UPI0033B09DFA